jgi:hypothetical protein
VFAITIVASGSGSVTRLHKPPYCGPWYSFQAGSLQFVTALMESIMCLRGKQTTIFRWTVHVARNLSHTSILTTCFFSLRSLQPNSSHRHRPRHTLPSRRSRHGHFAGPLLATSYVQQILHRRQYSTGVDCVRCIAHHIRTCLTCPYMDPGVDRRKTNKGLYKGEDVVPPS